MPPKRKAVSAPQVESPTKADNQQSTTVTVIPPVAEAPAASKTPSVLRFPLLLILSLSLSALANTINHEVGGDSLVLISPDGNPQWQIYATTAWRVLELGVGWFAGFDALDIALLTTLTHLPHLYLLSVYYELPIIPLLALLGTTTLSTSLPFYLLRRASTLHARSSPDTIAGDTAIFIYTTLLSTLLYSLPYLSLTTAGYLPTFLATHFNTLRTLEAAHASTLPTIFPLILPLGFLATQFFFPPAASALSETQPTTYTLPFDPIDATLGQTLHRNVLWHLYLPARSGEMLKRIVLATALMVGNITFWSWIEVDGTELIGAMGWAGVWGLATALVGTTLAWVGGLLG